jgi:hypothetical protein
MSSTREERLAGALGALLDQLELHVLEHPASEGLRRAMSTAHVELRMFYGDDSDELRSDEDFEDEDDDEEAVA